MVALGALLAVVLVAAPAAADAEDSVVGYDMSIELEPDGVAHVTLDLDMDFGVDPNRGPFLTHIVKQQFDDTRDRVYRFSNIQVSSSTGAVDTVSVEENGGWLEIRIGEEDRDEFTGVHSYRITYDVDGWVNTVDFFGETTGLTEDEFYVNVIGDAWEVPLQDVRVRVAGPADVVAGGCFAGYYGADDPCTSSAAEGAKAVFTQDSLAAGEGMTVYVAFPAGTFDADPILVERWTLGRAFTATPARAGLAVVIGAVGAWLVLSRVRRRGRDEQYLGLTPGLAPAPGQVATVGARGRSPVTVQFTPPAGFRAGQLGTLVDERADPHDVTATIVDLAVRGYVV
ncbi:MAG TPA: DUF2207 domain-containing protein, partial [Actinotalea sp.]|nr:DUF2207 domain-containing protein [Actinotalea sp.]